MIKNINKSMYLFLLLSLFLVLSIFFRSLLMKNFIEPIAILFWAFWRIISSLDQRVYWGILIMVCLVIMIGLFPLEIEKQAKNKYGGQYESVGRLEYWQTLIFNSLLEKNKFEYLRSNMNKLLISFIAQNERLDPLDVEKAMESRQLFLPPIVYSFLFPINGKSGILVKGYKIRLLFLFPKWFRRRVTKFVQPEINSTVDEILKWIESIMEKNHGK